MPEYSEQIIIGLAALAAGIIVRHLWGIYQIKSSENEARKIQDNAKIEAKQVLTDSKLKAKEEALKEREKLNRDFQKERNELKGIEKRLTKREDTLDLKLDELTKKDQNLEKLGRDLTAREHELQKRYEAVNETIAKQEDKLLEVAGYSREQAQEEIFRRLEANLSHEIDQRIETFEERFKEESDTKAQNILSLAIQRLAVDYTTTSVVSTVELPGDEMKGRIIGREGRNIRAFEKTTGVDVIVDDTPGVVVLSGFDPIRRETARLSMQKLVTDGRIHPARIEEVVDKTKTELEKDLIETGKQAAMEVEVKNLRPRELFLLGRLKYRTSYGQNVLDHSREVAFLSGMLATEMKLNEELARRAGLLHDIGKAVDHEEEGTHPEIGANIAKRCDEVPEVINAIASHHECEVKPDSLYAVIVQIADAISAARPGARRETLEKYIKRLEKLESIASSHVGIDKAFAIQAGREVRVIAKPDKINDKESGRICREIAQEIERELSYPGEVKITLIRENRFVEYAR
ncbi:MAG: ribonuclease Y [Planctomycetota bacterium]|jgi:ribonuclease Y